MKPMNNNIFRIKKPQVNSKVIYLCFTCFAAILAIQCPGRREDDDDDDDETVSSSLLKEVIILFSLYTILLLQFFHIQGSDPGYITEAIMTQICEQDGRDMMGNPMKDTDETFLLPSGTTEMITTTLDKNYTHVSTTPITFMNVKRKELLVQDTPTSRSTSSSKSTDETLLWMTEPSIPVGVDDTENILLSSTELRNRNHCMDTSFSSSSFSNKKNDYNINEIPSLTFISNVKEEQDGEEKTRMIIISDHQPSHTWLTKPPSSSTSISSSTTRRKRCTTCNFCPPLRSHHCFICNQCVATFDHHCIFLDTCIGERNHCRFWWFITMNCIGIYYCLTILNNSKYGFLPFIEQVLFPSSMIPIITEDEEIFNHSMRRSNNYSLSSSSSSSLHTSNYTTTVTTTNISYIPTIPIWKDDDDVYIETQHLHYYNSIIVILMKLYTFPFILFGTALWCTHTFLAITNSTTFEMAKGYKHIDYLQGMDSSCTFPFSTNFVSNLFHFCCLRDDSSCIKSKYCFYFKHYESKNTSTTTTTTTTTTTSKWIPMIWKLFPKKNKKNQQEHNVHNQHQHYNCC